MTYAKYDDNYFESPALAALSDRAFRAHSKAWLYCARNLSDGFVPFSVAVSYGKREIAELVEREVWVPVGKDGYHLPDFLVVNDSREVVEARRRRDAERKRSERNPDGVRSDTHVEESARSPGVESSGEVLDLDLGSRAKPPNQVLAESFDEFWRLYPRKVGKPKAREAFKRAVERAKCGVLDVLMGAGRFRDDPHRTEEFTPHPTTWLNRDGWEDDPLPARGNGRYESPLEEFGRRAREEMRRDAEQAGGSHLRDTNGSQLPRLTTPEGDVGGVG